MKRCLTGVAGLLLLLTSGCAVSWMTSRPSSTQLVADAVSCPTDDRFGQPDAMRSRSLRSSAIQPNSTQANPAKAEDVQVLSTQRWSKGVIVLYSALCPSRSRRAVLQRVFGYKVVRQNGVNWQVSGGDSFGTEHIGAEHVATAQKSKPANELVDYSISHSTGTGNDRYAVLYGQFLDTKVAAIEATFDNGQIIRSLGSNGTFALLAPGARGVCELRLLGPDNQILRQDNLNIPNALLGREKAPRCLPVKPQLL